MRRIPAVLTVVAALALAGCGRGGSNEARVRLDGSPRYPDAEGIVTDVSFEEIVLAGGERFTIDRSVQVFSTQTMEAVPLLQRKGQFVHIGVDGSRAAWVAAVGSVVPGDPPRVYYVGRLRDVRGEQLVFEDGTVLRLSGDVDPPAPDASYQVAIDPGTAEVTAVDPA